MVQLAEFFGCEEAERGEEKCWALVPDGKAGNKFASSKLFLVCNQVSGVGSNLCNLIYLFIYCCSSNDFFPFPFIAQETDENSRIGCSNSVSKP